MKFFSPSQHSNPILKISLISSFIISLVLISCSTPKYTSKLPINENVHYSLVVDAGSSGSRMYVYKVEPGQDGNLLSIKMLGSKKVKPGVSEFEKNPEAGVKNIQELLKYAKEIVEPGFQKQTTLHLLATAGMRLYSKDTRSRIMNKISKVIRDEGSFDFKEAKTISGRYEGLYGWLALNYLDDQFNPESKREGLLEMGGASTQIAFTPEENFKDHKLKRKILGERYKLYSRSYLYMGINEAEELLAHPACYSINYKMPNGETGTGDCEECANHILDKFNALCEGLECSGPHCIFKTAGIPLNNDDFSAVSSFYYVFKTLGLSENIQFEELKNKGCQICETDYQQLLQDHPYAKDYVHQYCMASTYYWLLFKNGYKFPENSTKISPKNEINDFDITWTLGAVLDMEMGFSPEIYTRD